MAQNLKRPHIKPQTKARGKKTVRRERLEFMKRPPALHDKAHLQDIKVTKKEHKRAATVAKNRNISIEEALAMTSSLPPTRLVMSINYENLIQLLKAFATLMSYSIQHKGSIPKFNNANDSDAWSPSLVFAYLITATTSYLLRCGAFEISTEIPVMREYVVPTFIAKWLQQMAPITHMGRRVVPALDVSTTQLLNFNCGTGGLDMAAGSELPSGFLNAPCYIGSASASDKEGWWSYLGPNGQSSILPINVTSDEYNKISSIISQTFPHVVVIGKIPAHAASTELKMTPVAPGLYGDTMYSCVDSKNMIDVLLPLCSMYNNSLINSPDSVQVGAPVRVDGGLCISPESKIALMYNLANKHAYEEKHTFKYYLRCFGVSDNHMGNLILNLRQVNWIQIMSLTMQYASCQTNLTADGYWYLVNYLVTVILSNIPAEFRAISPFRRDWNVAPLFKTVSEQPQYASFARQPKIPPFIAQFVKALREPIRYDNQITFYVSIMPSSDDPNWWMQVATSSGATLGGNEGYGKQPSVLTQTGLSWNGSSYQPYPSAGVQSTPPSNIADVPQRNYCCLNNIGPVSDWFSRNLTSINGNQNLWNIWNAAAVNFTRRHGKYYIVSGIDANTKLSYPDPNNFAIFPAVGKLVMSFEPATAHTANLALVNLLGYFSPSDDNVPMVGPTFSARPTQASTSSATVAMSAANPGQGTPQQVQVGTASNPAEVQSRLSAESVAGVLTDCATQPPSHTVEKVTDALKTKTKTVLSDAADFAEKTLSSVIKSVVA